MNHQSIRDAMIESLAGVTSGLAGCGSDHGQDGWDLLPGDVRQHLARDGELRLEWQHLLSHARELRSLPRVAAPADLDGRVVASLQAGYRQERAVRHVQDLPGELAPSELTSRVSHVAEDPLAGTGSGPQTLSAPPILDQLVAAVVRRAGSEMTASQGWRRVARGLHRHPRLAVAAALVMVVGLSIRTFTADIPGTDGGDSLQTAGFSFRIVRIKSVADADPEIVDLLGALSGGMLDGRERDQ